MPIVTLLVNGGVGSLEAVAESISLIPLVTIAGSGRAAEVIVGLHKHYSTKSKQSKTSDSSPLRKDLEDIYRRCMDADASDSAVEYMCTIVTHINQVRVNTGRPAIA